MEFGFYTIQPVVLNSRLNNRLNVCLPVVQPVVQTVEQRVEQPVVHPVIHLTTAVEQQAASCKQTFNRLSKRLNVCLHDVAEPVVQPG